MKGGNNMASPATDEKVETVEQRKARISKEVKDSVPANREEDATLARTIENATALLEQKAEILTRIQEARQLSTLLINQGSGSREQVEWVLTYLPRKKRKGAEVEDETEGEGS